MPLLSATTVPVALAAGYPSPACLTATTIPFRERPLRRHDQEAEQVVVVEGGPAVWPLVR